MCKVLSTVSDTESGPSQRQLLRFAEYVSLAGAPNSVCARPLLPSFPPPPLCPILFLLTPFFKEWRHPEITSSPHFQLIVNTCQLALEPSPCSSIKGLPG